MGDRMRHVPFAFAEIGSFTAVRFAAANHFERSGVHFGLPLGSGLDLESRNSFAGIPELERILRGQRHGLLHRFSPFFGTADDAAAHQIPALHVFTLASQAARSSVACTR